MKKLILFIFLISAAAAKAQVADTDNDGVANNMDNCIFFANPAQEDDDADAIGNVCDCNPSQPNPVADRPTGILVTASADTVTPGTPVVFTTFVLSADTAPVYQWYKNNLPVGTNSPTYTDSTLQTGDTISCSLTSNVTGCDSGYAEPGNQLTIVVTNLPSGIKTLESNSNNLFSIFPNPAKGEVYLQTTNYISRAELLNTTGQLVKEWNTLNGNQLSITEVPQGMYFLKAYFKKAVQVQKVIVE